MRIIVMSNFRIGFQLLPSRWTVTPKGRRLILKYFSHYNWRGQLQPNFLARFLFIFLFSCSKILPGFLVDFVAVLCHDPTFRRFLPVFEGFFHHWSGNSFAKSSEDHRRFFQSIFSFLGRGRTSSFRWSLLKFNNRTQHRINGHRKIFLTG